MLAWIRTPRGSVATATAVAAVLTAIWLAPHAYRPFTAQEPHPAASDTPAPGSQASSSAPAKLSPASPSPASSTLAGSSPATVAKADQLASSSPGPIGQPADRGPVAVASPGAKSDPVGPDLQSVASAVAAAPTPSASPTFDVVRVEPSGDAVVAGRGAPGRDIALLDNGNVVATVRADENGQFALLPPKLSEGNHYLTLQAGGQNAGLAQGVAVSVAKGGQANPMVALLTPDEPVKVLSDGSPVAQPRAQSEGAKAAAPFTPVAIQSVETAGGGSLTASGVAHAGHQCRLYLNGAYLADVTAGKDGRWSVKVNKGVSPGRYSVRADEIEPASGKVVNRVEVPFDYPVRTASSHATRVLMAETVQGQPSSSPSPVASPAAPQAPSQTTKGSRGALASKNHPGAGNSAPGQATPVNQNPANQITANPSTADSIAGQGSATDKAKADAVIDDLQTAKVIRGDSLWRISRKMLGHGINYTEIYASNESQIRDPKLIYPGQVFVVPHPAAD